MADVALSAKNLVLHDRCRTSVTFSSAWQAWYFLHVAQTSAGVGQNERWFWWSLLVPGAVFGELGQRFERVESLALRSHRRI